MTCRNPFGVLCVLCALAVTISVARAQQPVAKPPSGPSGIVGTALIGPISPVERPGVPNNRPLPGAIVTVEPAKGGGEVARATADQNGRFRIQVAPGAYRIIPPPPKAGSVLPRGERQDVQVRPGVYTRVKVHYDSGIR
jgi:hypothetical protein